MVETLELLIRASLPGCSSICSCCRIVTSNFICSYYPSKLSKVEIFLNGIGSRESLGTVMNLLLLMLLRSHLPASLRLIVRVTSKLLQKIKNA